MKKIIYILPLAFLFHVQASAQIPNTISNADKIYGLSKFWQEVNYNFIYLEKVDKKMWDSAYKAAIVDVQKTTNDYEYFRTMQKFCALLKDGHTNVYLPQSKAFFTMTNAFGEYNIFLQNFEGKAIVVKTNLSKKDEIPFGSEVIEVNGKTTQQYINDEVAPYISSSTDYVLQDGCIKNLLRGLEGESYDVKIKKPDGKIIALKLTHKKTEEKELFPAIDANKKLLDFSWQKDDIAYVSLNSFAEARIVDSFKKILPELYKAKALIIDLRFNGGGSSSIGKTILEYFINDTLLYGSRQRSRLHIPSHKAWGAFLNGKDTVDNAFDKKSYLMYRDEFYYDFEYAPDTVKLTAKRIVVPTVVLIGHNTASAAEDFLIYADNQNHFIKMGSYTFGSTGQPFTFSLPGKGSARVCTKADTYPDGRVFVGVGIKPDVEVVPTLNDYLQKKDVVLESALKYVKNRLK
jgi:C-terminal processing protease CtpA/Prc